MAAAEGLGQSLEVVLVLGGRTRVETREPQGGRGGIEETHEPPDPPPQRAILGDAGHTPLVGDDGRCDAERHHVRQAVVLLAERAFRMGPAGHATVQGVEHHGDEHGHAGVVELPVDRRNHRIKAGK